MMVRQFSPRDLASVNKWLKRRGSPEESIDMLPSVGYIVPGVAAAFLRNIENNFGMFESLVTNSLASSKTRNTALEELFKAISQHGFKVVIGFSRDDSAISRALASGYKEADGYKLLVKRF